MIPIYKDKGNVRSCGSCRSVKILEHGMKVIETIFEKQLRNVVRIDEMQMGFMPKRETINAIFILRHMLKKFELGEKKLYLVFVDLEKGFDHVPRKVIWGTEKERCT